MRAPEGLAAAAALGDAWGATDHLSSQQPGWWPHCTGRPGGARSTCAVQCHTGLDAPIRRYDFSSFFAGHWCTNLCLSTRCAAALHARTTYSAPSWSTEPLHAPALRPHLLPPTAPHFAAMGGSLCFRAHRLRRRLLPRASSIDQVDQPGTQAARSDGAQSSQSGSWTRSTVRAW